MIETLKCGCRVMTCENDNMLVEACSNFSSCKFPKVGTAPRRKYLNK